MPDTIIALRYSIRPYPRGCFLSGSFPASFVPTIVIIEDRASDRLFTASRMTAIELDANPMIALKAASMTFARMPMMLVLMMTLSRLSSELSEIVFSFAIFLHSPSVYFSEFYFRHHAEYSGLIFRIHNYCTSRCIPCRIFSMQHHAPYIAGLFSKSCLLQCRISCGYQSSYKSEYFFSR